MGIFFSFLSVLIKIIMYNGLDDINFIIKLYKSYKLLKINDKHKKKVWKHIKCKVRQICNSR